MDDEETIHDTKPTHLISIQKTVSLCNRKTLNNVILNNLYVKLTVCNLYSIILTNIARTITVRFSLTIIRFSRVVRDNKVDF